MRQLFILVFLFICQIVSAQEQYKITYTGKLLSSSLSTRLALEVPDHEMLEAYKEIMNSFEVKYALYVDVKNAESIFVEEKEFGLDGPPPFKSLFSYYKNGESIYYEDLFRGKKFLIKDTPKNLNWTITNMSMSIGQFKCKKAVLKNDPFNTVVWFSEQYPLPYGPYTGIGLPGLVVLLENDYYSIKVNKITKEPIPLTIQSKVKLSNSFKGQSINSYFKEVAPLLQVMKTESLVN